jgi:hypothetical protein
MQTHAITKKSLVRGALGVLTLSVALAAQAQTYSNAVMALNPVAYWPLNETAQPPSAFSFSLAASNSGSLGAAGTGYYGAWYQPSGNQWFLTNNIVYTNGIAGSGDKAIWCQEANGQYVVVPRASGGVANSNLTLTPPFSLEAWVLPNNTASTGPFGIIAEGGAPLNYGGPNTNDPYYGGPGTGYGGVVLAQYGTFFLFDCFSTNGTSKNNELDCSSSVPQIGKWNHIVCTFDGTHEAMWVNGTNVANKTLSGAGIPFAPDPSTPLIIGSGPEVASGSGEGGIVMKGVIDEVAIYNTILPQSSIQNHYSAANSTSYPSVVLSDNPVLYYRFNDSMIATNAGYPVATYPVATNYGSLGSSANGAYQPGTTPGVMGPPYVGMGSASAVAINGFFGAVDVGGGAIPSALNPTGKSPLTVVSWFQGNIADAPARYQDIVGHGNSSYRLALGTTCGENRFNPGPANTELQFFNPTDLITNHAAANDGNWHMTAGVSDGTNAYLYVDGVLMKSTNSVTGISITGSSLDLLLGGAPDETVATFNVPGTIRNFDGQIAQVAFFSNALSSAQIQSLYNAAGVPVSFITQPVGTTNNQGTNVTLTAVTRGSQPITYEWYRNNVLVSTQTNASLTFSPITTNNAGNYYLVVSNISGVVTSAVFNVTVYGPPVVAQQTPTQLEIFDGSNPTLNVTAYGALPLSYQWSVNSTAIPGATASSYTVPNVQANGTYTCLVSNNVGTTTSTPIAITALTDPTAPFPSRVLADGPVAYFRLDEASGTTAYDYVGGNNGQYTNASLGVPGYDSQNATQSDPTETAVEFGDYPPNNNDADNVPPYLNFGTPNGVNAELSVEVWVTQYLYENGGDSIVALGYGNGGEQFVLDTGGAGGSLRFFGHTATGAGWAATSTNVITGNGFWHHLVGVLDESAGHVYLYMDGVQIGSGTVAANSGLQASSIPLSIGARESGNYTPISNDFQFIGRVDDVALYNKALSAATVQAHYFSSGIKPFNVQVQPANVLTNQGSSVTFTATAQGTTPFTYTWMDNNNNIIAGQTNSTLTLTNVQQSQSGSYSVEVANAYGSVTVYANLNVVLGPPQIQMDLTPTTQTVYQGDPVTYTVVVSGSQPFSYQWYQDGTPVGGATNSSYTFSALAGTNTYYVAITNQYSASQNGGPTYSQTATVIGVPATILNSNNFTTSVKITFAGYTRNETLLDFPVLVQLSTNIPGFSYNQFSSTNGADLRFAEAGTGRELPYEIDQWNDSNGISSIWVQVPQIAPSNSFIWAYWGNSNDLVPPSYTTNGAVWVPPAFQGLPGYDIVYHLKEANFPYLDSTLDYTSTNGNAPTQAGGIVGDGELFNGSANFLDSGVVTNLDDEFTLSAWVNIPPGTSSCQTIWADQPGGFGAAGFSFFVNYYQSTNQALLMDTGLGGGVGGEVSTATGLVTFGQWHNVAAAVNRTNGTVSLYVDGLNTPIVSGTAKANFPVVADLNLGRFTNNALYFTGQMDEARIHQGVDSSNWLWASYLTVASNSVFANYGNVSSSVLPPVMINIARQGNQVVLTWPQGTLQTAPNLLATFTNINGATSPYTNAASNITQFYRVKVQ